VKRIALGLIAAAVGLFAVPARALTVDTLRQSGPVAKRFNMVVLGDGYRAQDQAQLSTDAKNITDYIFQSTPFKNYASLFNLKLVHVVSTDNGADNGTYGTTRNTALGAYFNCSNIDRLLCIDVATAQKIAADNVAEVNLVLVVVNDPKYGGSGGDTLAVSTNSQSFEIAAHEIGHTLAKLADEYDAAANYAPCDTTTDCTEGNVTLRNTRDKVKWNSWIDAATPVPTPPTSQYMSAVGLFEGARYLTTGVYRPWENCKMRVLGSDYCPVCKEQFVLHYWNLQNINLIEDAQPTGTVTSGDCNPVSLTVTDPPLTPSTYKYTWTVDGKTDPTTTNTFSGSPTALGNGTHQIKVLVQDTTTFVRDDPNQLLQDQHSWTVNVTKADCGVVNTGGAGGMGGASGASGASGAGAGGALAGGTGGSSGASGASGANSIAGNAAGGAAGSSTTMQPSAGSTSANAPPPEAVTCNCGVAGTPARSGYALFGALALGATLARRKRRPIR